MAKPYQLTLAAIALLTGLTVCTGWITSFIASSNELETVAQAMAEPSGSQAASLEEGSRPASPDSGGDGPPSSDAPLSSDSQEPSRPEDGSSLPGESPSSSGEASIPEGPSQSGGEESGPASQPPAASSDPGPMSATSVPSVESSEPEPPSSFSEPSSTPSFEPSSSPPPASSVPSSSSPASEPEEPSAPSGGKALRVLLNGVVMEGDAYDLLCRIVEAEVGESYHTETLKAQAVAAYSYILYENAAGRTPSLPGRQPSQKTKAAVSAVLGQTLRYGGGVAFTPYHASCAGYTNSSAEIWGGSYPYLVSVESPYDPASFYKNQTAAFSVSHIKAKLEAYLGASLSSSPEDWFGEITANNGGYVAAVVVYDAAGTAYTLTGRQMRENVLGYSIRSHAFTLEIQGEQVIFTTNGYGHGVGMSQTGANGYAVNEGWSYSQILAHYYPGTTLG